ncbi:GNAT family N-acetyltransferase [Kitasatospora nipponensis]|uniref:GNAT family N-acetyltransferase n=1 Tax=Kitasatospora nipponensis TaxID=258049 RepID=A0ABN1WJG0_9ACTN
MSTEHGVIEEVPLKLSPPVELRTPRLLLRPWQPADREPFARLNADPEVMEYLPAPLDREASDALADRIRAEFEHQGWGWWAVEVTSTGTFVGFTGLSRTTFTAPFTPATEVGWRLARAAWGHGYATEAAAAAVRFGFDVLGLPEIVSFTTTANRRSRAVMERLGMTHAPDDDFDHPRLPPGHPLSRHALYRLAPAPRAVDHASRTPAATSPGPNSPTPQEG